MSPEKLRPEGAQDSSHGWSAAQPVVVRQKQDCPEGANEIVRPRSSAVMKFSAAPPGQNQTHPLPRVPLRSTRGYRPSSLRDGKFLERRANTRTCRPNQNSKDTNLTTIRGTLTHHNPPSKLAIESILLITSSALSVPIHFMRSMALEVGIVGLPNVGKSTLFNALTSAGALAANYPFATIEPNVGVVSVPDERLNILNKHQKTEKIIPAQLRVVDIAGIVRGASAGEGLGNKFLSHIREVDAILHVVRCFEDPDVQHVDGSPDPTRDIDTIDTELAIADLETVSKALDNAERKARTGDKESLARAELLKKIQPSLNEGKAVRSIALNADEQMQVKQLGLLTAKRVLYVMNVAENDLDGTGPLAKIVRDRAMKEGGGVVPVCAKIEAELSELPEADRKEMLDAVGLKEPALATLAREAYKLLGLQSYFTCGPKEIRAWTIPIGAKGPQAAGVIHTDFEKGYIRAEVYSIADLETHKTEAAIKAAGRMRLEGKEYVMRDGDVCHFLFNV